MNTPVQLAQDHLGAINDAVRGYARRVLGLIAPPGQADRFPVQPDDLLEIAWLRLLRLGEREPITIEIDQACSLFREFIREVARELAGRPGPRQVRDQLRRDLRRIAAQMRARPAAPARSRNRQEATS